MEGYDAHPPASLQAKRRNPQQLLEVAELVVDQNPQGLERPCSRVQVALLLRGPLALILGFHDPVTIAKLVVKFADALPKLEIKGAVLDGQVLPPAEVKALAMLPPREVVLAQLLGLLQAPASRLLRTINEPAAQLARLLDQISKTRGANGQDGPTGSDAGEGAAS